MDMRTSEGSHLIMTLPRPITLLLGLAAVIAGILAMHVWTGGHGTTSHHITKSAGHAVSATEHGSATAGNTADPSHSTTTGSPIVTVCGETCSGDGLVMSLCVLALMVMSFLGLKLPREGVLIFGSHRRTPLRICAVKSIPPLAPSLTQLSISRT